MRGFNTVVVIGSGDIACKCIKILADHHDNVVCIEHEKGYLSMMKSICQKYNCRYKAITEQEQLLEYFNKITVKTLIVSANNNYIFPEAVLDKQNLSVINFHNALLPHHGGRNAPTWAIFQMDETTGITWHEVTPKVDAGDIIIQRGIVIAQDMTALELARKCMEVGAEAFQEIIPKLLAENYTARVQLPAKEMGFHYSGDIPNAGIMDISWSTERISAFLRSLDYGKIRILPRPRVVLLDKCYVIERYHIIRTGKQDLARVIVNKYRAFICSQGLSITLYLKGWGE